MNKYKICGLELLFVAPLAAFIKKICSKKGLPHER